MLTVDFDRLGLRPGRAGARHGLRRRSPRLRDVPPRRRRDRLRPGRRRAGRRPRPVRRDAGGRRGARGRRGRRQGGRRARRCRSPTASSTGSSPPRCSSTSPPTSRRSTSWSGCSGPGGTMAVTVPRWFPEIVCWKLSDDYHNVPGGHIRIYTDKELIGKVDQRRAASSRARTTPTACTRRTGGSSAPSASRTTTTRSRRRTTSCWSGTS